MTGLRRRLLGTLGLIAVYGALNAVPLPGLDPKLATVTGSLSILGVGITTSASAFLWVEVVAMIVPRWRRLRLSFAGRAKLDRTVMIVTMALGAMQIFGVILSLEHLLDTEPTFQRLDGNGEAVVGLCLYAGMLIAFFLARTMSKLGLVNGFVLMTAIQSFRGVIAPTAHDWSGAVGSPHPWALLSAFILPLAATLACLPEQELEPALPEPLADFELPVPASSAEPVAIVVWILGLPTALSAFSQGAVGPLQALTWRFGHNALLRVALGCLFAGLMCWAYGRARNVRRLFSSVIGDAIAERLATRALRRSIAPTLLFIVTLTLSELLLSTLFDMSNLVLLLPTAAVVVLDFAAALRVHHSGEWTCAWRDPRPYAFTAVRRLLQREGIDSRALSRAQNTLFRVFCPYALSEVWVPTAEAARATELIEAAFRAPSAQGVEPEADYLEPSVKHAARSRKRLYLLGAVAVASCLMTLAVLPFTYERAVGHSPPRAAESPR